MDEFPEVKVSTSIGGFGSDNTFMWYEDESGARAPVQSYSAFGVDSSFLDVFSFPLLQGDRRVVLDPAGGHGRRHDDRDGRRGADGEGCTRAGHCSAWNKTSRQFVARLEW